LIKISSLAFFDQSQESTGLDQNHKLQLSYVLQYQTVTGHGNDSVIEPVTVRVWQYHWTCMWLDSMTQIYNITYMTRGVTTVQLRASMWHQLSWHMPWNT